MLFCDGDITIPIKIICIVFDLLPEVNEAKRDTNFMTVSEGLTAVTFRLVSQSLLLFFLIVFLCSPSQL